MYDFFRGTVAYLDNEGHVGLDVNGVGYRLRISEHTRATIPLDGSIFTMHARLVVRDDDLILFGFSDPAERAAFDLLTAVSGVGPAVAMAVLSHLGVQDLRQALATKDAAALKKVKGVGAKSAERMVLELHDKVERIPGDAIDATSSGDTPEASPIRDEAARALVALGFSAKESDKALAAITDASTSEEYVRQALLALR